MNALVRRAGSLVVLLFASLAGAQETGPRVDVGLVGFFRGRALSAARSPGQSVVAWVGSGQQGFEVSARRYDADGQPLGEVFAVNTSAVGATALPAVAIDGSGAFTVVWSGQGGSFGRDIVARRFDAGGAPQGAELRVNSSTAGLHVEPAIAMDANGEALVVWSAPDGSGSGVFAQAYAASGAPRGAEFRVNAATADMQAAPQVAANGQGQALVVWGSRGQDGSEDGVYGRRVALGGAPLGAEFRVNTFTDGIQSFPAVGALADDGFVVAWVSTDGSDDGGPGIFAQRYDAAGSPRQGELRVGGSPVRYARSVSVAGESGGGFAVAWAGAPREMLLRRYDASSTPLGGALSSFDHRGPLLQEVPALLADGAGRLDLFFQLTGVGVTSIHARRYAATWPMGLGVDAAANRVLEPGEAVKVAPAWLNNGGDTLEMEGQASAFTGPGAPLDPAYVILGEEATYAKLPPGALATCTDFICFTLGVTVPTARPARHLDATFREALEVKGGDGASRTWALHVGGSFDDVPRASPFYRFAETLLHFGVSGGCAATAFCPDAPTTREQMAAFLLTAKLGQGYLPPRPAMGVFTDVPAADPFAPWVEDLWNRAIVEGCGTNVYCPADPVTRAQMAVMLLRTREGTSYVPPACTAPVFADVPCGDPYARWINELSARGITAGCGGGNYCPGGSVSRAQMAVFITRAFGLDLDAPATLAGPADP